MARPAKKYEENVVPHLPTIKRWIGEGKTVQEICKLLDINRDSFYNYLSKHGELTDVLKKGREAANERVVQSLFQKATGYEFDEVTIIEKDGKIIEKKTIKRHYPASDTAIAIWLNNRLPNEWRQRQVEQTDPTGTEVLKDFSASIEKASSDDEKVDL